MLMFSGVGRLTKDPVSRQVGENSVCKFSMAFSKKIKDKEYTDFFDFEVWGKGSEVINKYCQKGDQLFVAGEPRQEKWEKDGQTRTAVTFRVNDFQLLGGKKNESKPAMVETEQPAQQDNEAEVPF
jgi:single-strand DNA-binding protein